VEITAIQRAESTFEHAPRSAPQGRRQPSTTSGPSASFNGRTAADDNQDDDDARATARLPIKMGKRLAKAPKRRIQDDATSTQAPKGGGRGGSTSKETVGAGAAETTATGAHGAHGADGSAAAEGTKLSGDALLRATKLEIATLASDILHDPDNSMQKLRKLRELCSHNDESVGPSICKLAILSLATVFKDIIPGYRIRELSDMEKSSAVSAAVKKTRDYDQSLLRNYQMFLKRLHAVVKKASDKVGWHVMDRVVACLIF
jgi:nucleolar complex protein 3